MTIEKKAKCSILITDIIGKEVIDMRLSHLLKQELDVSQNGTYAPYYFRAAGYRDSKSQTNVGKRADAIHALFTLPKPHIYKNDLIAGSIRPLKVDVSPDELAEAKAVADDFPERGFSTNSDHYSPDYDTAMKLGIPGLLKKIRDSESAHEGDAEALDFLGAMKGTLLAFRERVLENARVCRELMGTDGYDTDRLEFMAKNCETLADAPPSTFSEALQFLWMIHTSFLFEGRFAMALGRIDQYLYPFYRNDVEVGRITDELATELLENVFMKIYERRIIIGSDDTVNICIGGMSPSGESDVNPLSYLVLRAVQNCNIPGPNLSARIAPVTPDDFLDECLKVIGTGLGYPALMNDSVNIEALSRYGFIYFSGINHQWRCQLLCQRVHQLP